jgi:hypothetical protein
MHHYYRWAVPGGEFVLQGEDGWLISFNGIRIGGVHRCVADAIEAIYRCRTFKVPGPNLQGIVDPPCALDDWQTPSRRSGGSA